MSLLAFLGQTKKRKQPENTDSTTVSEKNRKYDSSKRARKFISPWKNEFPWLHHDIDEDVMFCIHCRKFPKTAQSSNGIPNPFSVGTNNYRKDPINSHESSRAHLDCIARSAREEKQNMVINIPTTPIKSFSTTPLGRAIQKMKESDLVRFRLLFNTAYVLAKNGKPLSDMDMLCQLQEKNGVDIGVNYRNNQRARDFVKAISDSIKNQACLELKQSNFISILADGSTDTTISEQELVYARYVNKDGEIKTQLLNIEEVASSDSVGVYNGICAAISSCGLSMADLVAADNSDTPTLVSACFDGAAVMQGHKNGVISHITKEAPWVIPMHCIAHKLELAALDAIKKDHYLQKFETVMKGIFLFYHYSPKRRREVKEIATLIDSELCHISSVKQVRWLASKHRALIGLVNNYEVITTHFEHAASRNSSDEAAKAKGFLRDMLTVKFVHFLHHLTDCMVVLSSLSKTFQKTDIISSDVITNLEAHLMKLQDLKTNPGNCMTKFNNMFNPVTKSFLEIQLKGDILTTASTDAFIDKLITHIEARFENFKKDPLVCLQALDYRFMPDSRDELLAHGTRDLSKFLEHFSAIFPQDQNQHVLDHYINLKVHLKQFKKTSLTPQDVLVSVLRNKAYNLTNVLKVVEIALVLSPSTAECERGFSTMNRIKTSLRNSLQQETLQLLLNISIHGPSLQYFQPDDAIERWMSCTSGGRYINGHSTPMKGSL